MSTIETPGTKVITDLGRHHSRWSTQKYEDAGARARALRHLATSYAQFERTQVTWFDPEALAERLISWGELVALWARRNGITIEQAAYAWLPREFKLEAVRRLRFAYAVNEFAPNSFLNTGINLIFTLIAGTGGTKWDNGNAEIGVGNDNTATDPATHTDLVGASKAYALMEAGYPTYGTSQKATFEASFDGSTANFHWEEHVVRNGSVCLNRKVEDEGTKTSGQVWVEDLENSIT